MNPLRSTDFPELVDLLVAAAGNSRLLLLDDAAAGPQGTSRELLAAASPGHVAVLLRLETKGAAQRLLQFMALPFRLRRAGRALRAMGVENCERFAVSPDVRQPVIIYSLRPPAAAYARNSILPSQRGAGGVVRWLISRWAGCDASVGAVLVVGSVA